MNVTDQDVAALTSQAGHLMAAKMFSLACCVMLFYDILITFGDEVEKIWKQRFSFATILWFMNRYLSPLGYIVIIVSFHANWSDSVCNRYVLYPEVLKIFTAAAIGVIFILRLYSIYGGSMVVLVTFSALLVGELAVKIWAFTDGTRVNLPPGLVGCILTGKGDSNDRFVFTWVAELIFDSIVFIATLSRTLVIYRRHRQGAAIPLIKVMMRDGIVYFLVIFAANVVTVTLFVTLPPDLKAINASFSTLVTSLMVSRLILNLRSQAMRPHAAVLSYPSSQLRTDQGQDRITSTVIGNLGEPVGSTWLDGDDDEKVEEQRYAMDNLKLKQMNRSSMTAGTGTGSGSATTSMPSQIVVEVTRTRSITTDLRTRAEHAYSDYYPSQHPSYPTPYPYPYQIDGSFSLSQESEGSEESYSRAAPSSALSHSHSSGPGALGVGLGEGSRRPRSARSDRAMPQTRARVPGHDDRVAYDNERDNENEQEDSTGIEKNSASSSDDHTYPGQGRAQNEVAGGRRRGDGADGGVWRPPPDWMLENVDVCELGKPRRPRPGQSRTRGRRPSTS